MRELSMTVYLIFMLASTLVAGIYGGLRQGVAMRKVTSFRQGFGEGFARSGAMVAVIETLFFIYFWFTFWGKM